MCFYFKQYVMILARSTYQRCGLDFKYPRSINGYSMMFLFCNHWTKRSFGRPLTLEFIYTCSLTTLYCSATCVPWYWGWQSYNNVFNLWNSFIIYWITCWLFDKIHWLQKKSIFVVFKYIYVIKYIWKKKYSRMRVCIFNSLKS